MGKERKFKQTEIGMIPEDWEVKEIKDFFKVNTGKGFSKVKIIEKKRFPVKGANGIIGEADEFLVDGKFILTGRVGTIGTVSISEGKCWISDNCIYFNSEDEKLTEFLYYYLRRIDFSYLNVGSTQPLIKQSDLKKFKFPFPPKEEREFIAKILSDLDNKIEFNQQMNKTLEAVGQAIFKHWFVDFEFPNEEGKPYKSSGGEMIESELGKIPKGWKVEKAINLFKLEYGWHLPEWDRKEGKIPVFGSGGLSGLHNASFVKGPGIVIGRAGKIGSNSIYYSHRDFCPLETTFYVSTNNNLLIRYLYFFIKTMSMVNTGSSVPNLSRNSIHDHRILISDLGIIERFDLLVEKLFDMKYKNEEEMITLSQIRDSLLPKLMSGKIRVPIS